MIRSRIQNIGGAFPGRGAAPEMIHDKALPSGGCARFERFNDGCYVADFGSLVAANDNQPANDNRKEDAA